MTFSSGHSQGRPRKDELSDRKQRLLDVAEQVFLAKGFVRTSMDDIALAASVSKATIYRHYVDKLDLFRAVAERAIKRITQQVIACLEEADDPLEALTRVARLMLDVTLGDIGKPSFILMLTRIMASEQPFHEDLVNSLHHGWDGSARDEIARYLERMTAAGKLEISDHGWAARALVRLSVPHIDLLQKKSCDELADENARAIFARRAAELFYMGCRKT